MLFDPKIAKAVGTDAAIILQNIEYWVTRREEESTESNYYDGHYWTYNSARRFAEIFDWVDEQKVSRCLRKLEAKGYLISGNYNKHKYDRTKWYSLRCKRNACTLCNGINQKRLMDSPSFSNANDRSVEPIPDTKHRVDKPPIKHYSGLGQTSVHIKVDDLNFLSVGSERSSSSERFNGDSRSVKKRPMSKRLAKEAQTLRKRLSIAHGYNLHFYEAWEKRFGKPYPWPDDYENDELWEKLSELEQEWDEEFEVLIELYLLQDFREKTNYRIHHFLSDRIQTNLQNKIITSSMKNEHREKIRGG
ncbi:MAG: hypothetical protein COZ34_02425 [Candidatus Pacebacteria bacterium CG_4_10_14_3_um_filter_34_15]|nr:MAG: hypothetical protein AUJ41_01430 [Candidatus Pacebacteria bacterium CG1_02_43_31]PIQ80529.1 MAG: hypothetical protein COV78_05020 [Candidatus Pacebacteria bacterium CG11_big_fil_rev_8_21_14_0_20_34_55]PIX81575.1 MAG: hypothetical protein COZ34_02425 [Candidatus Pacebacteria bacterium CG_4_10_14_3_um_filter_34_15]